MAMNYGVERTVSEGGDRPLYTLVDPLGSALLVADYAQSTPPEERRQLQLTRPGGRLVATIDLPQVEIQGVTDQSQTDYAIIHDFAVYAIISVCRRSDSEGEGGGEVYYVLEAEGETWLALPHPDEPECYALYDEVPSGLQTYDALTEEDLPNSIGRVCQKQDEKTALAMTLAPQRLQHADLVLLTLGVLLDQAGAVP